MKFKILKKLKIFSKPNFIWAIIVIAFLLIFIRRNNVIIQLHIKHLFESCNENYNEDESIKLERFNKFTRTYALMSTTLDDNYTFNIPVVVHAWRKINIEPIVLIITDDHKFKFKENSSSAQILKYLNRINVKTLHLEANRDFSIVISQVIRLFIGIFPNDYFKDDDFVITTDSDLAPLKSSYYNFDMSQMNITITIWNAFCCGNFHHLDNRTLRMFPMGHIGMTKRNWRNLIDFKNEMNYRLDGDSIIKMLLNIYGNEFKQDKGKGKISWYADQRLVSLFVHEFVASNKIIKLDLRAYCGIRLDRTIDDIEWNGKLSKSNWLTDAHLFQWQNELVIRLFENFLFKCFSSEQSLIEFYQKLFSKFWKF